MSCIYVMHTSTCAYAHVLIHMHACTHTLFSATHSEGTSKGRTCQTIKALCIVVCSSKTRDFPFGTNLKGLEKRFCVK